MNHTFAEDEPVNRVLALYPMAWQAIDNDYSMEMSMYDAVNQGSTLMMM